MADFSVVFDPMLDKERAEFDNGSGGSGGSSYVGGERINIAGGTISFVNSADIVNVTGTSVTLQPDTAYKIYATSQAITLNANSPAAGKWAYEGHLEIFVAGTGYVQTGANVVLANALEPDAVNNCTVRFHDGLAIISVEDHVAGYIVVSATGSTAGTLPYALGSASQDYVAFDAALNGQTLDMGGAVTNGEKHVVGNGYTETIVSGGINCTSKTTFANLGMNGVVVSSGTLTLGDVYIPSGGIVNVVSGGSAILERLTLDGTLNATSGNIKLANGANVYGCGVFDGNGGRGVYQAVQYAIFTVNLHGGTYTNCSQVGYAADGEIFNASNCVFAGNHTSNGCLQFYLGSPSAVCSFESCTFADNTASTLGQPVSIKNQGYSVRIKDCNFGTSESIFVGKDDRQSDGTLLLEGSNTMKNWVYGTDGSVVISSGAILDLTGNTNATPINPGGGVIVSGACTVINSAGASVSIAGGTYTQINNDGTTE